MNSRAAICAIVAAALTLSATASATEEHLDAAAIADVFVAACAVTDVAATFEEAEPAPGIERMFVFQSGPPPGTLHGAVRFRGRTFELVVREGAFCVMRFDPTPGLEAEMSQRFGRAAEDGRWRVVRSDGDGFAFYRPFIEGQAGPAWVGRPGGHIYGVDAAQRADTLVFHAPGGS